MDIERVIARASESDKVKLVTFHNAVIICAKAYREDPTEAKLRNWRAAEQALDAEISRVAPADTRQSEDLADDHFPHKLAAWEYLRDSGWQIGRSQFYEHCKQGRLPRKDGRYLRADVDRYAENHCKLEATGEKVNETLARQAEEKSTTELEREKVRLERERHELAVRQGKVVEREAVEQMIVGRAVAMLSHLKAMVQMKAGDWIAAVDGDQSRARELIDIVQTGIEEHIAVFARDIEFEVIFEKNSSAPVADNGD